MSIFETSQSYRPFKYPYLVNMTKKHSIDMHWTEQQVELQDDLRQYNANDGMKTKNVSHAINKGILNKVLCLFTELDKTVAEGYSKLIPMVKNNEVRNWFLTVSAREVIHQRAYALAAETFGFDDNDWREFQQYVEMVEKIDLMTCYQPDNKLQFAKALTTLLLGEGIGLFASFTILLNFKRFGLMIGFNDINQWSLLDENEHVLGNIFVLEQVRKELSEPENKDLSEFIHKQVKNYVEAEHKFIDLIYSTGDVEGLTKDELKEYINYLGEFRQNQLGELHSWQVRQNPLEWVDYMLVAKTHDNFFEKRVTDYSHKKLEGSVDYSKYQAVI